ncbi:Chromodomain-helicase-DNA-binding protein 1 [Aphelenchoides bicaudatus]|nr:Chromodomain-helicase-DNA-binding protein 1 [Aphelenchoides bicaudatus]
MSQADNTDSVMGEDNSNEEENDDEEDEGIFEVDHIMDTKMIKGVRHFFVRWKGYDETEDSWEPEENVAGAKEIVANFMANYKPKPSKQGRSSKNSTTPKSSASSRKRRSPSKEPESEPESDNDDYSGSKRKKKKTGGGASTSRGLQPKTESFPAVSALDMAVKRKMNANLRWLDDDSDGNLSDNEMKLPSLTTPKLENNPPPDLNLTDSNERSKEKKKKKKSKKHSKDKDRSSSPVESTRRSTLSSVAPPPSDNAKVTVLGVYRPDDSSKNEFRFIVRNHSTNQDSIMTLAETFLADGWQLCRYLASRIRFQANGDYKVEINGEVNK